MRHQKQGKNECMITSIAILMDIDREQLLDIVKSKLNTNHPWDYLPTRHKKLGLEAIKETFADRFPHWLPIEPAIYKVGDIDLDFVSYHVQHFRGALIVANHIFGAHIVAYEYGNVFDSALPMGPLPFKYWFGENYQPFGFTASHLFCDFDSYD